MFLTTFKNVLASSNPTRHFLSNICSPAKISNHKLLYNFPSLLSYSHQKLHLLWSLQVKVDNLSFTMPFPSAAETWESTEWSLVCLTVPMFVCLTSEPMNIFWLSIFNKSAWYLGHKHFLRSWNDPRLLLSSKILRLHLELGPALLWENINFLADVKKDTIYIIDISTAWKTQTKNPRVNFS